LEGGNFLRIYKGTDVYDEVWEPNYPRAPTVFLFFRDGEKIDEARPIALSGELDDIKDKLKKYFHFPE
jgi:hypothetical protein